MTGCASSVGKAVSARRRGAGQQHVGAPASPTSAASCTVPACVSSCCAKISSGKPATAPAPSDRGATPRTLIASACRPQVSLNLSAASCAIAETEPARRSTYRLVAAVRRAIARSSQDPSSAPAARELPAAPRQVHASPLQVADQLHHRRQRGDEGLGRRDAALGAGAERNQVHRRAAPAASPSRCTSATMRAPAALRAARGGEQIRARAGLGDREHDAPARSGARLVD